MKVLHLIKTSQGASWALLQARELVKLGVEVAFAMPGGGPRVEEAHAWGIKVYEAQFNLRHPLRSGRRLREIVADFQPDLIHSHFVLTTLIMRMALRDLPTPRIFQVPGPLHLENFFFRTIELALAQKQDYWVGSCQWTCQRYAKSGIASTRIFLSYYGNDKENSPEPAGMLKRKLGLREDDILVGMVAFFYAPKYYLGQTAGLKGHEDFIDAIALLLPEFPKLHAVCIGKAWDSEAYFERVVKYGQKKCGDHIHFPGYFPDVEPVYKDLNLVVHPSHSENLGGAAESLRLGVPTISTTVGGFVDIVLDGKTGRTVPPRDPVRLAAAIKDFILHRDEWLSMAERGKKYVYELLNVRNTAHSMFDIYNQIKERAGL